MHLDDERVQRLLHGELKPTDQQAVEQHLTGCAECRAMVDHGRSEEQRIFGLLREVDHRLPEADPRTLLAGTRPRRATWQRWAAGFLLVAVAGGAAYAAPGSPLPRVLSRIIAWADPPPPSSTPVGAQSEEAPLGAGIALDPGDRLTIRFAGNTDGAVATVSLVEGREVTVRATAGSAAFTSGTDLLSVVCEGGARFDVLIPRSAPRVDIVAGERPVFRVDTGRVVTEAVREPDGRYLLSLSPRGP